MIVASAALLLTVCQVWLNLKYQGSCWGLQPGGLLATRLYLLQLILALVSTLLFFVKVGRARSINRRFLMAFFGVVFVLSAGINFKNFGSVVSSAAGFRGYSNLIPFFAALSLPLFYGFVDVLLRRQSK